MALPTQKLQLTITHVPTDFTVSFPAYLDMFSDAYTSTWNAEDVFGRMDPIATYINTRRALSIAWNVPAESFDNAKSNLQKVNKLMSFLYPVYDSQAAGGATAINQAPLLRISFGNLIRNADTGGGLLGYALGFTFDPDLEQGMFYTADPKNKNKAMNVDVEYYPKTFRLNTEFNVLHEHALGFQRDDTTSGTRFTFREKNLNSSNYPYATAVEKPGVVSLFLGQTNSQTGTASPQAEALGDAALKKGS